MQNNSFTLWSGPATPSGADLFPPDIDYTLPPGMEITDNQVFVAAHIMSPNGPYHSGRWHYFVDWEVPVYDDGYGPLWMFEDTGGVMGIARAQRENEAWEICEDKFYPEANETVDELKAEYNFRRERVKIIRFPSGEERPARLEDHTGGLHSWTFVRWETVETPAEDGEDLWPENALFQEAYGFRPNGPNVKDKHGHGIFTKDLNGERMTKLGPDSAEKHRLRLTVHNGADFQPMDTWSDALEGKYQIS